MENYDIDKMSKEELEKFIKSDDYYRDFVLYKNYLKFGEYFLKNKVVREKRRFVEAIKSLFKHFPKAGQIVFTKLYGLDENNPIPQTIEEFSKDYNIEIKDIKFTDEFITKSSKEYLKYLSKIMIDNNIGIKYQEKINKEKLKKIEQDYDILSVTKMRNNKYSNEFLEDFISKSKEHLYIDGIISRPYVDENKLKDILILVPKTKMEIAN